MISLVCRRQRELSAGRLSVEWDSIIASLTGIGCHAIAVGQFHFDDGLLAMTESLLRYFHTCKIFIAIFDAEPLWSSERPAIG